MSKVEILSLRIELTATQSTNLIKKIFTFKVKSEKRFIKRTNYLLTINIKYICPSRRNLTPPLDRNFFFSQRADILHTPVETESFGI